MLCFFGGQSASNPQHHGRAAVRQLFCEIVITVRPPQFAHDWECMDADVQEVGWDVHPVSTLVETCRCDVVILLLLLSSSCRHLIHTQYVFLLLCLNCCFCSAMSQVPCFQCVSLQLCLNPVFLMLCLCAHTERGRETQEGREEELEQSRTEGTFVVLGAVEGG